LGGTVERSHEKVAENDVVRLKIITYVNKFGKVLSYRKARRKEEIVA
jgi:hypothetical protein